MIFRKVSKYDLDRMTVDFSLYAKEKREMNMANVKLSKKGQGVRKQEKNTVNLVSKMMRINDNIENKKSSVQESKKRAKTNQENLSNLLK